MTRMRLWLEIREQGEDDKTEAQRAKERMEGSMVGSEAGEID